MKTRVQSRVVTLDPTHESILLVRNPGAHFWYAPGGGLEEHENIQQCAVREVLEETGLTVRLNRLLYAQELHDTKEPMVIIEFFWLAELSHQQTLNNNHIDPDPEGGIAEAKWFTKKQLQNVTVYPERLKDSFWDNLDKLYHQDNPFIGVF